MAATSAAEKDELIAQFINVTGADRERASFFLESSGWKLQVAMDSFFENPSEMEAMPPMSEPPSGSNANVPMDEPERQPVSWGVGGSKGSTSSSGRATGRVATLGDYSSSKAEGDSDEEGQAFYAGGADHGSGQQVVGPKKKKKKDGADSLVQELFKQAKEHGAEEVGSGAPTTSQGRAPGYAFRGAGYRLGELPTEPVVPVPGTAGTMPGPRPRERHVVLKLWKTGFSVDDGELRDYKSPENDAFLRSVMKGEIPDELIRQAQGGEVSLDLEDHRTEEYVKPKSTTKAFSGQGFMLGSPTPAVVSHNTSSQSSSSAQSPAPAASLDVDSSQPVTTLQLRLADGSRLSGKFNHSHTVGDVRNFITSSRPQYAGQSFNLMTTFPNKTLTDDGQTIADAKLQNAVIVQRLT